MEIETINRIAVKAASAVLKNVEITRVDSEPTADSYGDDALNVTIIFKGAADYQISGDEAVNTIFRIQRDLTIGRITTRRHACGPRRQT